MKQFRGRPDPGTDTRSTVGDLLLAIASNDTAAIKELYADEVDYELDWPRDELQGDVPWIRCRRTAEDMARHYADIASHNCPNGEGTTVDQLLVEGCEAVVFGTIRNKLLRRGTPYDARFALRLTVEEGRITRHHIYEDSLSVRRAWARDTSEE